MESKKRFKLFKSGKLWCCAAITTFGLVLGLSSNVHADTNYDIQNTSINSDQTINKTTVNVNNDSDNLDSSNISDNEENISEASTNASNNEGNISVASSNTSDYENNQSTSESNGNSLTKNGWDATDHSYYVNGNKVRNNYYSIGDGTTGYLLGDDGKALSGVQQWAGTYYYFDPTTYLKQNNVYATSQWGMQDMFGNDGRIVTGAYQWDGNTYYADPSTYLRVTNDYQAIGDGTTGYLLDNEGKALSGIQQWAGSYYYFDPVTYLKQNNDYVSIGDGTTGYLFGSDGRVVSGVQKWAGTYYYFDPTTYLKQNNIYVTVGDGTTGYLFGPDGRIITGVYNWQGSNYYFDPTTYLKVNNEYVTWNGRYYYAQDNGVLRNASTNEAFLGSIKQAALDGWKTYGVLPSVTAAQAILESAWGKSALATEGHNLFGIKGSYNGNSIIMRTREVYGGRSVYVNAAFRKYPSNYESVVDHGRFLAVNSRYKNLLWQHNYSYVTSMLQRDGYATDPSYASSLNKVIQTYGLDSWDREVF